MRKLLPLYTPHLFWILLGIKMVSGALFASGYVTKGFLPFIQYFLESGRNPYDFFQTHTVFPYPSGMLYVFSLPLFLGKLIIPSLFTHSHITLFLFRAPILFADLVIYIVLCKLLPSKERSVLLLYFASPALFYINYYHGQLDVVPTAFLFLALYLLFFKKYVLTYVTFGLGLAIKTHLLIALPFLSVYLYKMAISTRRIVMLTAGSFAVFLLFNTPFLSQGLLHTVFNNSEQLRFFFFMLSYQYNNFQLLLAPAFVLFVFYLFVSYKKVNFDSIIIILGLVFTILIALVPPMQGWFYWSIPLLVFFLIKYKNSQLPQFWLMNVFFLSLFAFTKDSDIFKSASFTFAGLAILPSPYMMVQSVGLSPILIQNLFFTALQVSVGINAYWCYKISKYYNKYYAERDTPFIFGIAGDSSVGKSTLAKILGTVVGQEQLIMLNGDDGHKWERGNNNWQFQTHLNPLANRIHKDAEQLYELVDGRTIERRVYSHRTGKFGKRQLLSKTDFILFQGLHPFLLSDIRTVYDLKIFVEADERLRKRWKTERDSKKRGYKKELVEREIMRRKKDAKKFIHPQKEFADWIIKYEGATQVRKVKHTFINSVPLDELVGELKLRKTLKIAHTYKDVRYQVVENSGTIKKSEVEKIAYKLYPNLNELLNFYPAFLGDGKGIQQLLFLNYLNFYYHKTTHE